ncbi:DUF1489 family protein, partial [Escherichia coli]|uniref:DUF1489 family protein n=1 Tax=Escherichia coli TaxID=562 RepID=UPI001952A336
CYRGPCARLPGRGRDAPDILHLLKLSVGPDSIADLEARHTRWAREAAEEGRAYTPSHTTRMVPKRLAEIAGQGSIYWVIRGTLCCRQAIAAIEPFTGTDGIYRRLFERQSGT